MDLVKKNVENKLTMLSTKNECIERARKKKLFSYYS